MTGKERERMEDIAFLVDNAQEPLGELKGIISSLQSLVKDLLEAQEVFATAEEEAKKEVERLKEELREQRKECKELLALLFRYKEKDPLQ